MTDKRIQINHKDWIQWIQAYGINDGVGYVPRLPIGTAVLANLMGLSLENMLARLAEYFPDVAIVNGFAIPPLIGPYGGTSNDYPALIHRTHRDPFYPDEFTDGVETGT